MDIEALMLLMTAITEPELLKERQVQIMNTGNGSNENSPRR
jgi:hypothetical protein